MRLRSLLFAPGDRPERFEKALASGADAVILDLEDSVAPANKLKARESVHEFVLHHAGETALMIRINPLASPEFEGDLAALSGLHPFAIVLPKAEGAASVLKLAGSLASAIPILPIATETPSAIFEIGSYRDVATSLCGLTWGAEDLSAAIGATTARRTDGRYTPPYELARSLTLFAAHAAAVAAIDTVYPDFHDVGGLRAYVGRALRDGFSGMMAIHPGQVETINHAFTPDASEIAWAEKVAAAFAARPDAGVIQLDGRMLDLPHLKLALRILEISGR
ncbi:HpcH/HpaI aldolase/citrate lyase family protein [Rhizobium leguminosarum]|uniref:CoA ester lyase n=1 Tax=Rhizobium leguminosarum TaxID=384 RepID=A0A6P0BEU1_RHILE|nr:CoA ester lyase [Rhizobium leguminosarum]MBY5435683.1 CoA ester lyase [Rhizobium leguminosarum]NEI37394.1 CoA ester lyase [Rhizobium leguminosarum]NEI43961.1 CoA ester lyase [Rhizobium leguminosarum]